MGVSCGQLLRALVFSGKVEKVSETRNFDKPNHHSDLNYRTTISRQAI